MVLQVEFLYNIIIFFIFCSVIWKTRISYLSLIFASSVLAFWIVNVYTGKIFLGDTGAYCLGFLIDGVVWN